MSFEWCFKFAVGVTVGGLLTLAEVPAQQPTTPDNVFMKPIHAGDKAKIAPQLEPPAALSLPDANQLTPLDRAYLDAFSILKENNACSAFYGGPSAIEVLNRLKEQLEPKHLNSTVVVRMTGETVKVTNLRYPLLSYRLFGKAVLNLDGPFYRVSAAHPHRNIGRFRPNTREARVTILLHELGHLIEGPGKQWLLRDDGVDRHLSEENTERVIAACGKEIRRLRRITFAQELQAARSTLVSR
jgi:hypothetical protein